MRRTTTTLLALSALALTGCGPATDDIEAMADGPAESYDDAVALREAVVDAGVDCPGTDQLPAPADPETTFLDCANGEMAMAVAGSEESMEELLGAFRGEVDVSVLQATNWFVLSRTEEPLQRLQDELGGQITANP